MPVFHLCRFRYLAWIGAVVFEQRFDIAGNKSSFLSVAIDIAPVVLFVLFIQSNNGKNA